MSWMQHIVAPLQEGGVDGEHRQHPLFRHAGAHGHGVAFRDTHVKKPFGTADGEGV